MQRVEYIFAHGSLNRFVMIDAVANKIETTRAEVAKDVQRICADFQSDGLLFLERQEDGFFVMNMYNTDGTQAEMCGNGMRLIARFADERYLNRERFTIYSGGRAYPIKRMRPTELVLPSGEAESIPNYGVEIEVRYSSPDFLLSVEPFVNQRIEALHSNLRFTYLNLGNPHIVTHMEVVDLDLLAELGEKVKQLPEIFPQGVNVSMMTRQGDNKIFVATYERGVGLTPSCGTAMTASSTVASLLELTQWGEPIEVLNAGGFVHCICHRNADNLKTQLIGNATYMEKGIINTSFERVPIARYEREELAWATLTEI